MVYSQFFQLEPAKQTIVETSQFDEKLFRSNWLFYLQYLQEEPSPNPGSGRDDKKDSKTDI